MLETYFHDWALEEISRGSLSECEIIRISKNIHREPKEMVRMFERFLLTVIYSERTECVIDFLKKIMVSSGWKEVIAPHHIPWDLEEWNKISHLFPPSFIDVWVMNGTRKCVAYLDAPNHRWLQRTKNDSKGIILQKVEFWKEIENV
jgi:hypothetical protein